MISHQIKIARKKAGKSAAECATALSLTVHAYRRWERAEVEPKASQCLTLAQFLDITIDQLLTDKPADEDAQHMTVSVQPGQRVILDVSGVEQAASDKPHKSMVKLPTKVKKGVLKAV